MTVGCLLCVPGQDKMGHICVSAHWAVGGKEVTHRPVGGFLC